MSTLAPVDPAAYRDVLGHYPTGVTVVTAFDGDQPVGMVVGTFTSVSLDPPLVAFMPTRGSGTYARLAEGGVVLHQRARPRPARALSHDGRPERRQVRTTSPGSRAQHGAPSLDEAVAQIHCTPESQIEAGDHYIVLCRVAGAGGQARRDAAAVLPGRATAASPPPAWRPRVTPTSSRRSGWPTRHARTWSSSPRASQCEAAALVGVGPDELTTAFSAYAGSAEMAEPLGERIPLIPPIGEAYVAGAADDVVERWLAKVSPQDEELLGQYRARLGRRRPRRRRRVGARRARAARVRRATGGPARVRRG